MKIEIDRGCKIPERGNKKYPWDEMEIGDSFLVKNTKTSNMSATIGSAGRVRGRKYMSRQIGPDVRVWRIA